MLLRHSSSQRSHAPGAADADGACASRWKKENLDFAASTVEQIAADVVKQWHLPNPTLTTGREGDSLSFSAADQATLAKCFKAAKEAGRERTSEGYEIDRCAAQAFCEVKLKKPAVAANKTNWVKDDELDWSDAWMFPLDIGAARIPAGAGGAYHLQDFMERPAEERGEVPDWRFLAKYFDDKGYTEKEDAIGVKKK